MKRAAPKHSHIAQAYLGLNLDFLPTLTEGHLGLSGAPKPPLVSLKIHAEEDLSVPTGWKKSRQSQTAATRKGLGKFLVR
jgi:hypothetical protein